MLAHQHKNSAAQKSVDGKRQRRLLRDAILPLIGFAFCLLIWWNLNNLAKTVGGIWFAIGLLYVGYKTDWFRSKPVMIDFSDS